MAEAQRFAIALVAGLMIFSLIPHSSAEADSTPDDAIEININEFNDYYVAGDEIVISPYLFNPSSTTVIQNNPSCDFIFTVFDERNDQIFSSEGKCRNQVQSLEIISGETRQLMSHEWDFKDDSGRIISTGTYRIVISHSVLNIDDGTYVTFFSNSSIPGDVELKYNLVDLSSESTTAYFLQVFLYNPTSANLELSNSECTIIIENNLQRSLFENCLNGTTVLHPNENIYSASQVLDDSWLVDGEDVSIFINGNDKKYTINTSMLQEQKLDSSNPDPTIQLVDMDLQIIENGLSKTLSIQGEVSDVDKYETCALDIHIVNDLGQVIVDSWTDLCTSNSEQFSNDTNFVNIFDWDLTNDEGCIIDYGRYTIILHDNTQFLSLDFFQNIPNNTAKCVAHDTSIDINSMIVDSSLYTTLDIHNREYIRITSNCMLVSGVTVHTASEQTQIIEYCDYDIGNFITPTDEVYQLQQKISLPEFEPYEKITIKYRVNFERSFSATETVYANSETPSVNPSLFHSISGTWDKIEYNNNHCWLISAPNSAYILQPNTIQSNWIPKEGWFGEYTALEHPFDSSFCSQFGLPVITIDEIFTEENPVKPNLELNAAENVEDDSIEIAEIAVYGVASSSILVGLLVFISNTEGIRIPVTSAGLWMLALVGKTHETSDGRFQRGRLIGYLTANPGCHFRALMAALNMSNGQITHHLRLLENQELIWRINDGRFVRYYPLNNSLYPGMNPDDLPVPPLSPDPKSLQGKILTLLDDEHQIGEFPTQSELAKKLEKSQQLISHHLRTLQKYGLVEKRKMGIKNRYKLTKEALFLLETDIDYNKIRD